jgi:hypothetical protein
LSVANKASTASIGSVGLSRAITITPWALRLADGRDDGLGVAEGVIRMVLAPAAIMFSMAVTWPALSPSVLPAAESSLAPSFFASAVGALLHLHEEGVGFGLGDQANDGLGLGGRAVGGQGEGGHGKRLARGFFHDVSSEVQDGGVGLVSVRSDSWVFTPLVWRVAEL